MARTTSSKSPDSAIANSSSDNMRGKSSTAFVRRPNSLDRANGSYLEAGISPASGLKPRRRFP